MPILKLAYSTPIECHFLPHAQLHFSAEALSELWVLCLCWAGGTKQAVPSLLSSDPAVLLLSPHAGAQVGWSFEVQQPEKRVWVIVGQTLTLTCMVTESGPPGPVKWLKSWGSNNQIVYDQKGSSHRVTRAVNESNTDFTIRIEDIHPEDAGTYYCVKFHKKNSVDEVLGRGRGTEVSVYETPPFPSVEVAAAVLCFILLICILAFCLYRRKQRGGERSQHVAEVTTGSCSPFPVPCCAGSPGTPSNELQDVENPKLPHQQSSEVDKDIHYADLQPLPAARWPSRSPGAERSEYASIRGAAK
ncbi:hypothetical protein CIB84_014191 [Bambusicola thoracicus]|uniref:Ig-like domain-containing protein n=1 Tax=Bambusicola thoracicus TaxID=9083 RepID=A0A2P4SD69_BAMTH|nr:hypothetical protein CIB84_014191 [Bambusicola thoracicus]